MIQWIRNCRRSAWSLPRSTSVTTQAARQLVCSTIRMILQASTYLLERENRIPRNSTGLTDFQRRYSASASCRASSSASMCNSEMAPKSGLLASKLLAIFVAGGGSRGRASPPLESSANAASSDGGGGGGGAGSAATSAAPAAAGPAPA